LLLNYDFGVEELDQAVGSGVLCTWTNKSELAKTHTVPEKSGKIAHSYQTLPNIF